METIEIQSEHLVDVCRQELDDCELSTVVIFKPAPACVKAMREWKEKGDLRLIVSHDKAGEYEANCPAIPTDFKFDYGTAVLEVTYVKQTND